MSSSIQTIKNAGEFRAKVVSKLSTFFEGSANAQKYGINLEKGVYNWSLKEATNKIGRAHV